MPAREVYSQSDTFTGTAGTPLAGHLDGGGSVWRDLVGSSTARLILQSSGFVQPNNTDLVCASVDSLNAMGIDLPDDHFTWEISLFTLLPAAGSRGMVAAGLVGPRGTNFIGGGFCNLNFRESPVAINTRYTPIIYENRNGGELSSSAIPSSAHENIVTGGGGIFLGTDIVTAIQSVIIDEYQIVNSMLLDFVGNKVSNDYHYYEHVLSRRPWRSQKYIGGAGTGSRSPVFPALYMEVGATGAGAIRVSDYNFSAFQKTPRSVTLDWQSYGDLFVARLDTDFSIIPPSYLSGTTISFFIGPEDQQQYGPYVPNFSSQAAGTPVSPKMVVIDNSYSDGAIELSAGVFSVRLGPGEYYQGSLPQTSAQISIDGGGRGGRVYFFSEIFEYSSRSGTVI